MGSIIPFFILHDSPPLKKKNSSTFLEKSCDFGTEFCDRHRSFPSPVQWFSGVHGCRMSLLFPRSLKRLVEETSKSRFVGKSGLVPSSMKY